MPVLPQRGSIFGRRSVVAPDADAAAAPSPHRGGRRRTVRTSDTRAPAPGAGAAMCARRGAGCTAAPTSTPSPGDLKRLNVNSTPAEYWAVADAAADITSTLGARLPHQRIATPRGYIHPSGRAKAVWDCLLYTSPSPRD